MRDDVTVLQVFLGIPLARLQEASFLPAILLGIAWGEVFGRVVGDPFVGMLAIYFVAAGADWRYGTRAANIAGEYSDMAAKVGLHGKIGAVLIVFILRLLELQGAEIFNTGGYVSTAITAALVIEDVKSIQRKRTSLGLGPIPLLSPALDFLSSILERLVPAGKLPPKTEG